MAIKRDVRHVTDEEIERLAMEAAQDDYFPLRRWMIESPKEGAIEWTLADGKQGSINRLTEHTGIKWPFYFRRGYRARRIIITKET